MKITRFEKVNQFREFELIKQIDNHTKCKFSFVCSKFEDYKNIQGEEIKVICDDCNLMFGTVESVEYIYGSSENLVRVFVVSNSYKMDIEQKTRVFQKENQTYREIIDEIIKILNYFIDIPASLNEMKLEYPIIQENETDFSFLKRIIEDAYGYKTIVDVGEDKKIIVGYVDKCKYEIKKEEVYSFLISENESGYGLEFLIQGDKCGKELREYVDIGKKIIWDRKEYIINQLIITKEDSVFRYKCIANSNKVKNELHKNRQRYEYYIAKVTDVNDPNNFGRVRLDFSNNNIEDMTADDKKWINVLTPYTAKAGGFVFIPDVDDVVQVLWNGTDFSVVGCIRQNELAEKYQKVENKQIGNIHNKNICFSEENIEISSDNSKVIVSDDGIKIEVSDTKITVIKDRIDIETPNSKLELDNDLVIGTSKLHVDAQEMENKINSSYVCESRNININASSKVSISGGTKVEIN